MSFVHLELDAITRFVSSLPLSLTDQELKTQPGLSHLIMQAKNAAARFSRDEIDEEEISKAIVKGKKMAALKAEGIENLNKLRFLEGQLLEFTPEELSLLPLISDLGTLEKINEIRRLSEQEFVKKNVKKANYDLINKIRILNDEQVLLITELCQLLKRCRELGINPAIGEMRVEGDKVRNTNPEMQAYRFQKS